MKSAGWHLVMSKKNSSCQASQPVAFLLWQSQQTTQQGPSLHLHSPESECHLKFVPWTWLLAHPSPSLEFSEGARPQLKEKCWVAVERDCECNVLCFLYSQKEACCWFHQPLLNLQDMVVCDSFELCWLSVFPEDQSGYFSSESVLRTKESVSTTGLCLPSQITSGKKCLKIWQIDISQN